jgi:hypothetical protein
MHDIGHADTAYSGGHACMVIGPTLLSDKDPLAMTVARIASPTVPNLFLILFNSFLLQ